MDIKPGRVYRRTREQGSDWFLVALGEAIRTRRYPIHVSIMTTQGTVISGHLEDTDANDVRIREPGEPDVARVHSDDIDAFTLLVEPPPAASDEAAQ